jgi:hypothetical protein
MGRLRDGENQVRRQVFEIISNRNGILVLKVKAGECKYEVKLSKYDDGKIIVKYIYNITTQTMSPKKFLKDNWKMIKPHIVKYL